MKYKIKITTFENGRKEYEAFVKQGWFWVGMNYEGKTDYITSKMDSRQRALEAIDLNFAGNNRKQSVEIEYINK